MAGMRFDVERQPVERITAFGESGEILVVELGQ